MHTWILFAVALLLIIAQSDGFAPHHSKSTFSLTSSRPVAFSLAAKKRRRRKDDDGDLPDFDIDDGSEPVPEKKAPKPAPSNEITSNMMGSAGKPTKSVQQLIKDRSLENKLQFGEQADDSIPDFTELAQGSAGLGKKKARQVERQRRAREAEEADEPGFLSKVPFFKDIYNEEGKVEPLKLLETGTWTGIFILVAWEVYINSPLFDRVAPMAPVVY